MSLTLHFHPLSSYCHKVLIALYENGTPFTPQIVNLMDEGERTAFRRLWPIGKFPVLRDDARGETVPESSVLIEYLDRHYPGATRFIPSDPAAAHEVRLRDRLFDYQEFIERYAAHPTLARLLGAINQQMANAMALGFLDLGLGGGRAEDLQFLKSVIDQLREQVQNIE